MTWGNRADGAGLSTTVDAALASRSRLRQAHLRPAEVSSRSRQSRSRPPGGRSASARQVPDEKRCRPYDLRHYASCKSAMTSTST